jgi:hypothetical protein
MVTTVDVLDDNHAVVARGKLVIETDPRTMPEEMHTLMMPVFLKIERN